MSEHLWRIDWKELGYPFCGVYAIAPQERRPTKIGITYRGGYQRLKVIQNAHWQKMEVVDYWYCDNLSTAKRVEKKVHSILKMRRLRGEWFDIGSEGAVAIIERAAKIASADLRKEPPDERIRLILEAEPARQQKLWSLRELRADRGIGLV